MSVITNGDREAAYERFVADGGNWKIDRVAAELGLGQRRAGDVSREWKARYAGNGARPASPELPPPQPAPGAIEKKKGGTSTASKKNPGWLVAATKAAVALVTLVAALMSYSGIRKLAIDAGLGWHSNILPLAVDGLVAICVLVRVVLPSNRMARAVMWLALAASVAANAAIYGPWELPLGEIAAVMAGFVPVTAAVGYHLLGRMLKEAK